MKQFFLAAVALLGIFVFAASAADVTGKWVAEVPGREGNTMTQTFNLKSDGGTVTGTVATQRGEVAISDGKISGDTITFNQTMKMGDNEVKMNYTGKIEGDTIKFTREREGGNRKQEFVAKRSAT
jgi:hypothetical protein